MINKRAKDRKHGQEALFIKVAIKMDKSMVKENFNGQMGQTL